MKQKKLQTHRQKKQPQKNKPFCLFQAFERRIRKLVRRFLLGVRYCRASTTRAAAYGLCAALSKKIYPEADNAAKPLPLPLNPRYLKLNTA
ncbi:hypothetical protein [Thalassococcus halodurans]|uniref:hypothetical protein n=1 Tax=Thalassococcus halodurans TaxID=373675 RepID=UPI0011B0BCF0|nr:hypothetical protein [Thalassococcus halodurans]